MPDATALNFGPLLGQAARAGRSRVRYREGKALLTRARSRTCTRPDGNFDSAGLAHRWATVAVAGTGLPDGVRDRAAGAIEADTTIILAEAHGDLAALCGAQLERTIWAGTGGNYALRAIGLEALRRGGEVIRFAHGGAAGLDDYLCIGSFIDLLPSSRFVVATDALAGVVAHRRRAIGSPSWATADIAGGGGDPVFRAVPARNAGSGGSRPRVLYVTTLFTGAAQHLPPTLPDALYYDWQLRLLESLQGLPFDVLVKPHPENLVLWNRQPLGERAVCDNRLFRTALAEADVLLFDFTLTTAFWEALCSDRPVVILDPAGERLNPDLAGLFDARCRRVPVSHDDRNRPVVDREALAAALAAAALRPADPMPFRALLAGDA
ncbi:MAG: hypothetical protein FJX53_11220 [Alphaproteobacteria bacterium]|nr:hypothetical protein [Alphaproteobacteria bacterium]